MSVVAKQDSRVSVQEYLRRERLSPEKHEYDDGDVLAMAGASRAHVLLTTNLIVALGRRLEGKPCVPYTRDLRVRLPGRPRYVYPDASVFCAPPIADPDDDGLASFLNPTLIVEVLSPSTEAYDRGKKFERYRRITSLREYVLVSQDAARVESFFRAPDGSRVLDFAVGIDAVARLRSLELDLPLTEVYARVELPPADADDGDEVAATDATT